MSGIAGICNRDGKPADPRELDRMLDSIGHRGCDARFVFVEDNAALGLNLMVTTPEAIHERLYRNPDSPYIVAADARIDNRGEIIEACGVSHRPVGEVPDSELIAAAYGKWGEDCPGRLLGDFAFAIWDRRQRRLFCVRDHMGARPFFYSQTGGNFAFASETQAPMLQPGFPARPNEGMIGEVLSDTWMSHEETVFQDLLRLPAAHSLSVGAGAVTKRRYWSLRRRETHRQSPAVYADQLRDVLERAVTCRLRATAPPVLSLSGGIDSSIIAVLAPERLRFLSLAFPGMACDESRYIEAVTASCGSVPTYVEPDPPSERKFLDQVERYRYLPEYPNNSFLDTLRKTVHDLGSNVRLTGLGGDDFFVGDWRRQAGPLDWSAFVRRRLWPRLPVALRLGVRRALGRPARRIPDWIHPALIERANLRERIELDPMHDSARHFVDANANDAQVAHSMDLVDRSAHRFGVEDRHPFRDVRVVEFSYGVPLELHFRDGQTKHLLRQAAGDLLPPLVRERRTKAHFSHTMPDAWAAVGGCHCPALCEREWVDGAALDAAYRKAMDVWARESRLPNHARLWLAYGLNLLAKHFR